MHSLTTSNKDAYFIYFTGEKHDPTNSKETVLSVKGLDQFAWDPNFIKAVLCPTYCSDITLLWRTTN